MGMITNLSRYYPEEGRKDDLMKGRRDNWQGSGTADRTKEVRVAILDSDEQNTTYLSAFIRGRYGHWTVSVCGTAFALATAVYDEFKGDVELLVIHVEEDGSIELARDLQDYFPHIRVIFYSGTSDCAEQIFRAVPTFFLRLPFREEFVTEAFERVRAGCEEDTERTVIIRSRGQRQKIRFSAIRYIESFGRKLFLYTDNGSFETYMTVQSILSRLPQQFTQCHRSYIVNTNRIEKYSAEGVLLTGEVLVPISKSYQKKMREILS